ncbi:MAG: aldo/keto reductase [Pirellulales bacterium]
MSLLRPLGNTPIAVTPVAMGCWPISGVTSVDVTEEASLATLEAALEAGINFFDTAYCYGYDGESERLVGRVMRPHRERVVIATKGGIHWGADHKQVRDARPKRCCGNATRASRGSGPTTSISTTCMVPIRRRRSPGPPRL